MDEYSFPVQENQEPEIKSGAQESRPPVRSLRELIDLVTGRSVKSDAVQEDAGLAEQLPYPFLAIIGQLEMKLALLLSVINPNIGGVLLIGPRGTGKTTAVRSLLDLLPEIQRSSCFYGCTAEDVETGGLDAICPDCARKYGEGIPLSKADRVRLVELPLNSKLEDVIGGLDERALVHERLRLKRGILAQADLNILYIDEVNLLEDIIVDAILDAAAQGSYALRRGAASASYRSRFTLIGSMNPEEGNLRPQIMDRFGLRVAVHGLADAADRLEVYQRVRAFRQNPRAVINQFSSETTIARLEVQAARAILPRVDIPGTIADLGIALVRKLGIDSLRAEITLFEAARAYAAADGRNLVGSEDIKVVAPMALRLQRSDFMKHYFEERSLEDQELTGTIDSVLQS